MSTGWFKAIPNEDIDPEGHDDGDEQWYYADSSGDLAMAEIKKINGQSYGFDQYGKMLHGLYKIEFEENGKTIRTAEEIESFDDLPDEDEDGRIRILLRRFTKGRRHEDRYGYHRTGRRQIRLQLPEIR